MAHETSAPNASPRLPSRRASLDLRQAPEPPLESFDKPAPRPIRSILKPSTHKRSDSADIQKNVVTFRWTSRWNSCDALATMKNGERLERLEPRNSGMRLCRSNEDVQATIKSYTQSSQRNSRWVADGRVQKEMSSVRHSLAALNDFAGQLNLHPDVLRRVKDRVKEADGLLSVEEGKPSTDESLQSPRSIKTICL